MTVLEGYELLTPESVPGYVRERPALAALVDPETLDVREVGDGNLNLVFVLRDADGRGLVLKQALPYVRLVGPSWPFTPLRAVAEARALEVHGRLSPEHVPVLHAFDADRYVVAMEDLSDHRVWRAALDDGERHPAAAAELGRYVARVAFGTSAFGRDAKEVRRAAAEAANPDLCEITEDLVLTEPFSGDERNWWLPALDDEVARMAAPEVLAAAGELKLVFLTRAEALVHGDLHTGSVMVRPDGSTKAFDPEFCFYGPVGLDVGLLWANWIVALARAEALGRAEHADWLATLPAAAWEAFEAELRRLWPRRVDPRVLTDGVLDAWLVQTAADAAGFAAAEAARRVVGLAHVSDLETLDEGVRAGAGAGVLRAARRLLVDRAALADPAAAIGAAREEIRGAVR
jgi:5-methylthioribose kinase